MSSSFENNPGVPKITINLLNSNKQIYMNKEADLNKLKSISRYNLYPFCDLDFDKELQKIIDKRKMNKTKAKDIEYILKANNTTFDYICPFMMFKYKVGSIFLMFKILIKVIYLRINHNINRDMR